MDDVYNRAGRLLLAEGATGTSITEIETHQHNVTVMREIVGYLHLAKLGLKTVRGRNIIQK